jgi:hypothetical protein
MIGKFPIADSAVRATATKSGSISSEALRNHKNDVELAYWIGKARLFCRQPSSLCSQVPQCSL